MKFVNILFQSEAIEYVPVVKRDDLIISSIDDGERNAVWSSVDWYGH